MTLPRVAALLLSLVACGRDHANEDRAATGSAPTARATLGAERSDCRPDGSCDPGLLCLSNLCVQPPPADCTAVGETLASFDLGNYAEPEERAPVVAKYAAACKQARVTKDEGKCVLEARDKYTAESCAPALFPKQAVAAGGCEAAGDMFRQAMAGETTSSEPRIAAIVTATTGAIVESCKEDRWPAELVTCMTSERTPNADLLRKCNQQMPPDLQQKLQERMQSAMQGL